MKMVIILTLVFIYLTLARGKYQSPRVRVPKVNDSFNKIMEFIPHLK